MSHLPAWSSTNVARLLISGEGRPLAIVIALLMAASYVWRGENGWQPVRDTMFDAYQQRFPRQVDTFPAIIVAIDDASLAALGQWPWPRTRLARLIDRTRQLGALVVGLDMFMPEADRLSPDVFIRDRADLSPTLRAELTQLPSNDAILAETLRRVPSVIGRAGTSTSLGSSPAPKQTVVQVHGDVSVSQLPAYPGHLMSIAPIDDAAGGRGYVNTTPDVDGVVRTVPLLVRVAGEIAPTFALELLRVAVGADWYSVHGDPHGVRGMQVGSAFFPTNPDGRIRLYYSPVYRNRRVSALDVWNGTVNTPLPDNYVAIIGVTSLGLSDTVSTPVTTLMEGVEVHAQIIENIFGGNRLVRPAGARWVELTAFLMLAAVLIVLMPRMRPVVSIVILLGTVGVFFACSLIGFTQAQLLFDPSFPAAGNVLLLVVLLTVGFTAVELQRTLLKQLFARHVSPEVAETIWQQREQLLHHGRPQSQRMIASVLFSDVVGFTTVSEKMEPQALMDWLDEYLDAMTPHVMHYHGVVLRFIGDAILAVFGVPFARTTEAEIRRDAVHAVQCALAMEQELLALNQRWRVRQLPLIRMRVGIFTGPLVAGSLGNAQHMEYNVHGDTVNTAARLENFQKDNFIPDTEHHPCRILIGAPTLGYLGDQFDTHRVGEVSLKGKDQRVTVYQVLGVKDAHTSESKEEKHNRA